MSRLSSLDVTEEELSLSPMAEGDIDALVPTIITAGSYDGREPVEEFGETYSGHP